MEIKITIKNPSSKEEVKRCLDNIYNSLIVDKNTFPDFNKLNDAINWDAKTPDAPLTASLEVQIK